MEEELDEIARGERAWVPLLRAFYGPLRDRVDEKRRELKRSDFTTEATDEVCSRRPPDGHPARAQRPVPGLLALPGAQGDPAAARRRAAAPGGDRRGLPEVRRGHARRQARPVRAVRRLLALSRLRLHQDGRPAAARSAAVRGRLPQEQGRPPRRRVARGGPGTSSGGAPTTRRATSRRTTSRSAACTTPTTARSARKDEAAICLICGSTIDAAPDAIVPGERYRGRPAEPGGARPAGTRGRPRRWLGAGRTAGPRRTGPAGRPAHQPATRPVEPAADA